jgi:DNA-directed RNA polymerase specialized sigma24 family protein
MTARFRSTSWTLVRDARDGRTPEAREALAKLCEDYWQPLYGFVRRLGYDVERARDLTQGFFARLIEKDVLSHADPARGRFRSFLMASIRHYASNEREAELAGKRLPPGGLQSLDFVSAEQQYSREPVDVTTPEALFERQWAATIVGRAVEVLQTECAGDPRKLALASRMAAQARGDEPEGTLRDLARELGAAEGALRMANLRLHQRFHALLTSQVAETVADPGEVKAELAYLLRVLAG